MKIFIDNNSNHKIAIDIHEFDSIGKIIIELEKTNHYFRGQFLIYENIILNSKKFFKFYEITENSEIWFGPIGNYLKIDEIIVEVFISAVGGDVIHVIVKNSEYISNIKSIIDKIIGGVYSIYDKKGCKLDGSQIINKIDCDDEYYKLIIRFESECYTFNECCRMYDRYLISDLLRIFLQYEFNTDLNKTTTIIDLMKSEMFYWIRFIHIEEIFRYLMMYSDEHGGLDNIGKKIWQEGLDKAKQTIVTNPIFDCVLPLSFMKSRFLLWEEIFETVDKLLTDFINFHNAIFPKGYVFRILGSTFISISIINYINSQSDIANNSMKSILINILNFCENVFSQDNEKFQVFVEHFVKLYTIENYNFSQILRICQDYPRSRIYSLPFHFKGKFCPIFPKSVKSIEDAKKLISYNTKLPIEQLYFTNPKGDKIPNNEDDFDGMENEIEIVWSLDDFEKPEYLGSGAFGNIYLCAHKISKDKFVIKVPLNSNEDLLRDISIQCRLKCSKFLLNYSELINYRGQICFVMKYLSGGSISTYLERHKLSEQQIAKWCLQILLQIYELHLQNIIHGDIKCGNIVLDEHNDAYLIDYGLSKYVYVLSDDDQLLGNVKPCNAGTARYMAPELITGEIYSNKIDIWSFGASVIEMVTGKEPYSQLPIHLALLRIEKMKTIEYKPLKRLSSELKEFIDFCIKWNPTERYTAKQLIESKFIANYYNKLKN